jgi:hypothetical protein
MNEPTKDDMKNPVSLTVNGVRINTPGGELEASGSTTITVLFGLIILAALGYFITSVRSDHASITRAIYEMKASTDDAFISNLVTEEMKRNLPNPLKQKLEKKLEEKARRVTEGTHE